MGPSDTTSLKPRDRILDAARDLFRKHGIKGVGVDAIASAADSNKIKFAAISINTGKETRRRL